MHLLGFIIRTSFNVISFEKNFVAQDGVSSLKPLNLSGITV